MAKFTKEQLENLRKEKIDNRSVTKQARVVRAPSADLISSGSKPAVSTASTQSTNNDSEEKKS